MRVRVAFGSDWVRYSNRDPEWPLPLKADVLSRSMRNVTGVVARADWARGQRSSRRCSKLRGMFDADDLPLVKESCASSRWQYLITKSPEEARLTTRARQELGNHEILIFDG